MCGKAAPRGEGYSGNRCNYICQRLKQGSSTGVYGSWSDLCDPPVLADQVRIAAWEAYVPLRVA